MLGGLAGTEDNLGKASTNLSVVVDARKAKVLERQMPKFFDSIIYPNLAVLDLLQQSFYLLSLNSSFLVTVFSFIVQPVAFGSSVKSAKSPALYL